jgi:hypothetical protein
MFEAPAGARELRVRPSTALVTRRLPQPSFLPPCLGNQQYVNGVRAYFARRPDETENTAIDVDRGLCPEIVGFVLRDTSWAAVETVLGQPDFFVALLRVYQEGRWPCSWKGRYPDGRFVVL